MSLESDLYTLLNQACPRVYPDYAPTGTAKPFVTWSIIGGSPLNPLGKTTPNRRQAMAQINVWSETRIEANGMMLQIDELMRETSLFDALPSGEMMTIVDAETDLRGAIQDFRINGYR
jgi:hypothetical protein